MSDGDRYYLYHFEGARRVERRVTQDEFIVAERAAGFRPKDGCGPVATGGFGIGGIGGSGGSGGFVRHAGEPLEDLDFETVEVMTELRRDAERWRAIIGCARVRALGAAGLMEPKPDGYAHIGIELWTIHDAGSEPLAVDWLTKFADIARRFLK